MSTPADPFSMRELDGQLENLWLTIKEEQYRTDQFADRMRTTSVLNSAAIIILCVAFGLMLYAMQKGLLPLKESAGNGA